MYVELMGKSGKKYDFQTSGFSPSWEPKFKVTGIFVLAQQTPTLKAMYIQHADNIHRWINDQRLVALAVERYHCDIILWRQGPPDSRAGTGCQ